VGEEEENVVSFRRELECGFKS